MVTAVVVALLSGGGSDPPASRAATVVPADALVYLHISTDQDRDAVKRALHLSRRFPGFQTLRDRLLRRLSASGRQVDFKREIRPWLGKEAALALLNSNGSTAGSLIVLGVRDRGKAQGFLARATGSTGAVRYRNTEIFRYGPVASAFVKGLLLIGQEPGLRAAIDIAAGARRSLAQDATFAQAGRGLARGRVLDAYVSAAGVRRLLAPQRGLLGAVGTLLNQPSLKGAALALTAGGKSARINERALLDPKLARTQPSPFKPFRPALAASVPSGAIAYLGLTGVDQAVGRLLAVASSTRAAGTAQGLGTLLQRAQADLAKRSGVNLQRDVLPIFRREAALMITPNQPTPALTLIARTDKPNATALALTRLQAPLARLFAVPGATQIPQFSEHDVAGMRAFTLRLSPTVEFDYALFGGKVVVSTSLAGIAASRQTKHPLLKEPAYRATLGNAPKTVTSLLFLDFRALLLLGERTGLAQDPAYLAVRDDLDKVAAVGAASTSGSNESNAEITLFIP